MTTKATPTTPKEFEEYLFSSFPTPEDFKKAFEDGSFQKTVASYASARNGVMDDIKSQVAEQVQMSLADMAKGVKTSDRLNLGDNKAAKAHAPGTKANGIFNSVGQFVGDALQDQRYASAESVQRFRNYSEKNPSEGGFLVPEEYRSEIMTLALEGAVVRPRATVVPMASASLKWPAVDFSTEVGEVYGGIVMAWLDEGQTLTPTDASFAAIELILHKLGGLASIPNELVRDAPALETWLRTNLPNAVKHFEDIGFLKGNGVKKPLGALHAANPALITASKESGQTSGITWVNVLGMFSRLLPESYDTAVWVLTPDAIPEVYTMALPVGTGGSAVMIGENAGAGRAPTTMLGLPLVVSRKAPAALNTQGDISLADFKTYVIGDGQEMRLDTSAHSSFRADKTDFRIIERVDGQPGMLNALTPENGGPTLSAYVQLETRS